MVFKIEHNWGAGFGWIMGLIILAVMIYTIIRLRKQVSEREASEERSSQKFEQRPAGKEVTEKKENSE